MSSNRSINQNPKPDDTYRRVDVSYSFGPLFVRGEVLRGFSFALVIGILMGLIPRLPLQRRFWWLNQDWRIGKKASLAASER